MRLTSPNVPLVRNTAGKLKEPAFDCIFRRIAQKIVLLSFTSASTFYQKDKNGPFGALVEFIHFISSDAWRFRTELIHHRSTTSHFLRNEQLDKLAPSPILSSALQDVFEINFPRASFEGFWLRIGRFPADLESGSRSFLACRSRRSLPCRLSERWQGQTHLHFRAVLGRNWTWRNMLARET